MSERILPPARHETRDVGFRPMLIAAILMLVALGLVALTAWLLFPRTATDIVVAGRMPRFPTPTLQNSPTEDMARFFQAEMKRLNGYGWVDRERGIVHVPIERAMKGVVQRGIPDWPTKQAGPKQ